MRPTGWRSLTRRGYWLILAALTAVLTACVTFSEYRSYDDEGYLLMFARKLLGGGRLYDDVFGQYGPAYAFWKLLLHGALGLPLTHTGVRLETLVLVLASLTLIVLGVHRLTGSTWAAALALYVCQGHVFLMADHEPGHPQFLTLLLLLGALWLAGAAVSRPSVRWLPGAAGAVVALLALTKLNAGLFLALAILAWLALPWARAGVIRVGLVGGVGVGLQLALFRGYPELWSRWGWRYWLVSSLALTAVVLASCASGERQGRSWPWWRAAAGAAGAAAAVALLTLARGTTPAALVDGVLVQPLRLGTRFSIQGPVTAESIALGTVGALVAAAWGLGLRRTGRGGAADVALLGAARLAFGAFVVWRALTTYSAFVALVGAAGLWLLAAGESRADAGPRGASIRALVALAVAWQVPYAFPVAGTQTGYVAALVAACGVVCLRDGLRWLALAGGRLAPSLPKLNTLLAAAALGGVLAAQATATAARWQDYGRRRPLGLRGAAGIRLQPEQVDSLRRLTAEISASGCRRLVSFPGMFSFNFWAAVDSPTDVNVTSWMILPAAEQLRLLRDIERTESTCILRNRKLEAGWVRRSAAADPVARWLELRPVEALARVGDYELSSVRERLGPQSGTALSDGATPSRGR